MLKMKHADMDAAVSLVAYITLQTAENQENCYAAVSLCQLLYPVMNCGRERALSKSIIS